MTGMGSHAWLRNQIKSLSYFGVGVSISHSITIIYLLLPSILSHIFNERKKIDSSIQLP